MCGCSIASWANTTLMEVQSVIIQSRFKTSSPVPKTVRKLSNGSNLMCTGKSKSTKLCTPRLHVLVRVFFGKQSLKIFNWALVVGKLIGGVLRVFGKFERDVFGDGALAWLEDTSDEIEKGGLAGTISTKNSNTGIHAVKAVIVIQTTI